jgi:subtilase family serine protease
LDGARIEVGQSQVIQVELVGALATATSLQLRVDDPNRIKEGNEANNAFQVK